MNKNETVLNENSLSKDGFQADIRKYLQLPFGEQELPTPTMSFTGLVDDNSSIHSGSERGKFSRPSSRSMAQFLKSDVESYKLLAKEIEEMGNGFFRYVNGEFISPTGRYISDVFLYRGSRELKKIMDILCSYGKSRRNGMFGISVEDDHIHIIHDCSYSGNSCRCAWKEKIRPFGEFGPDRKYNKPIWKFTRTDWYDVFIYFFLAKWGTREIWFRGESWQAPTDGI